MVNNGSVLSDRFGDGLATVNSSVKPPADGGLIQFPLCGTRDTASLIEPSFSATAMSAVITEPIVAPALPE